MPHPNLSTVTRRSGHFLKIDPNGQCMLAYLQARTILALCTTHTFLVHVCVAQAERLHLQRRGSTLWMWNMREGMCSSRTQVGGGMCNC